MVFIGRHALLIFSMHCLDWIAVDTWMNHRMWIRNIVRTGMVLSCSLLFYGIKNSVCKMFEKRAKNLGENE